MKKVASVLLLLLALIAAAALAALVTGMPSAYQRFDHEPEDLSILVTLSILVAGLGAFWVLSGVGMLRSAVLRPSRVFRVAAWLVLLVGGLFFLSVPFAEADGLLSFILASACVASAAAVLNWGRGAAGV